MHYFDRLTSSSLFLFLSLIFLSFPSILNIHSILFLNLTICGFSKAETIYESVVIVLNFLRELFVSFSGDAKPVVNSEIGVIGLKVADLFKDFFEVCDVQNSTCEVPLSFTEVFKNLSRWWICKGYNLSLLYHLTSLHVSKIAFLLTFHQPQTFNIYCTWNSFSRWPNHNNLLQ